VYHSAIDCEITAIDVFRRNNSTVYGQEVFRAFRMALGWVGKGVIIPFVLRPFLGVRKFVDANLVGGLFCE
jgi:hypothetical protein